MRIDYRFAREEQDEVRKDLEAFIRARDIIHQRVRSMEGTPRVDMFVEWAAFQVIWNGLVLAIARCEGLIEDIQSNLDRRDNMNVAPIRGDQDV